MPFFKKCLKLILLKQIPKIDIRKWITKLRVPLSDKMRFHNKDLPSFGWVQIKFIKMQQLKVLSIEPETIK